MLRWKKFQVLKPIGGVSATVSPMMNSMFASALPRALVAVNVAQ
jgi:hypothetical protein